MKEKLYIFYTHLQTPSFQSIPKEEEPEKYHNSPALDTKETSSSIDDIHLIDNIHLSCSQQRYCPARHGICCWHPWFPCT